MILADTRLQGIGPYGEFAIDVMVFVALIPFVVRYSVVQALRAQQANDAARKAALAEERRTLARELHDSIAQHLCYLHLKLDQLGMTHASGGAAQLAGDLEQMRQVANQAYEDIYCLMTALRSSPAAGLATALRSPLALADLHAEIETSVVEVGTPRKLQACHEQEIVLIVQEALANVEKHAHASHVDIVVNWLPAQLDITVRDNGRGFDAKAEPIAGHFGLEIMRERAAEMGGALSVRSLPGRGAVVEFSAPLDRIVDTGVEPCG